MKKEKIVAIPAALLMTALLAFPAMASEKIEEVTIDINAVLTDSDNLEVEADVSDDGCYVDEISITNEPNGDWNDDTKPKVKITIGAESDYAFSSGLSKSDVYLGNDEQKVTSVTRSTSKLYVYVTLQQISDIDSEYDDEDYDLDVYDLSWDDSYGGVAYWEGTEYAKKYQTKKVVLFGSRARRTNREKSDIDLAVYGCSDVTEFYFDIEEEVNTLLMFDVIDMDRKNISKDLLQEIERDGVIIYEEV